MYLRTYIPVFFADWACTRTASFLLYWPPAAIWSCMHKRGTQMQSKKSLQQAQWNHEPVPCNISCMVWMLFMGVSVWGVGVYARSWEGLVNGNSSTVSVLSTSHPITLKFYFQYGSQHWPPWQTVGGLYGYNLPWCNLHFGEDALIYLVVGLLHLRSTIA